MQRPGRQLLSRSTLAFDQHGGIAWANSRQELKNFFYSCAFSYKILLLPDLHGQTLIFLLQPLRAARVVQRHRRDPSHRGHQLQMILMEPVGRGRTVQVNAPNGPIKDA